MIQFYSFNYIVDDVTFTSCQSQVDQQFISQQKMVKIRGFDGLIFKPELYAQILHKNLEYMEDCQLFQSFNTQELLIKGVLHPEKEQFLYLYEQEFLGLVTLGLLAQLSLIDYQQNRIKKHERTLIRPHLNEQTYARNHVGPVIVGHEHVEKIDVMLHQLKNNLQSFAVWDTIDGRKHRLWRVSSVDSLLKNFEQISSFYILDGHHRFQAASAYLEKAGENAKEKDMWIQGLVYSTKYIRTYPQFRKLIHQDNGLIIRNLMSNDKLQIKQINCYDPADEDLQLVLLQNQKFYHIQSKQDTERAEAKTGVEKLDLILKEAIHSVERKTHTPIKFVPSIMFDLKNLSVHTHPVFLVKSPSISTIFSIANQDLILPPKSTWLQPKPCLHMVIRLPY